MKLTSYLADKMFVIVSFLCVNLLSGLLLWLIGTKFVFLILFECLYGIFFLACFLWDYIRKRNYYLKFWKLFDQIESKTLISEVIETPDFLDGKMLWDALQQTNKGMNDRIAQVNKESREYREYVEMWVHEIKTPITSACLMVENNKSIATLHMEDELHKIERYVEQALYYARSTSLEKDFKVEKTSLRELVMTAVKKHSKPIIQANGKLHFENLEMPVLADRKWCAFVLEQVIANAVKYRRDELELTFTGGAYPGGSCLFISDNGIGIPPADLPRIFDKGFTGEHGRVYTKSTGIGLYLCRKLCKKMNMDILVDSTVNQGTTVKITFPENDFFAS